MSLFFKLLLIFTMFLLGPAGAENLCSYKSSEYEVYTPDDNSLQLAKKEIEYARARFESLIGDKAPKIYVILFNSNEELAAFSSNSIKEDGRGVLKWFTQPTLEMMIEKKEKEIAYKNRIGSYNLPKPSLASSTLSHESAHVFLINYVDDQILTSDSLLNKITSKRKLFYGHPLIPDWLDEAIAIYCEQEDMIRWRISLLQNKSHVLIPLNDKFIYERPEQPTSQLKSKGGITISDQNKYLTIYYSQTIAFLMFLIDKEGQSIVKVLIKEHSIGNDFLAILKTTNTLPHNYIDLEIEFRNWLERYL